jgi:hypothetical protein
MTVKVEFEALAEAADYFRAVPEVSAKAATLAINQVATRGGLRLIQDSIMDQVAFPQDYLKGDRLGVTRFATETNPEAVIRARKRATSVARFARGNVIGRPGVSVEVHRGNSTYLKKAWLVRLKRGASLTEDNYNVGLAVRVKPGDKINNKISEHQSWLVPGHVALLYGPSVDQVFRDVADQVSPKIGELVAAEFFRQFERLS